MPLACRAVLAGGLGIGGVADASGGNQIPAWSWHRKASSACQWGPALVVAVQEAQEVPPAGLGDVGESLADVSALDSSPVVILQQCHGADFWDDRQPVSATGPSERLELERGEPDVPALPPP